MKKSVLFFLSGMVVSFFFAFSANPLDEVKKNAAEVDQVQGFYVFAKCKPLAEYEFLGTVGGPGIGNHEFDNLVELIIKKARREFPQANAIIFDGAIRQTHNTEVSVVKMTD